MDQILDWENYNKLPLFVTATCEFGRLDNPELTSGGEHIILNPNGGGVALLTTTRYVYSHLNYNLNTNFINSLFEKIDGEYPNLGDVFLQTKSLSGTSINSNKFTPLGDPMMCLAYPEYGIRTTSFPDTIAALGKVTFNGEINPLAPILFISSVVMSRFSIPHLTSSPDNGLFPYFSEAFLIASTVKNVITRPFLYNCVPTASRGPLPFPLS